MQTGDKITLKGVEWTVLFVDTARNNCRLTVKTDKGEGVRDAPLDMILRQMENETMENEKKDYPFTDGKMWEVDEIPVVSELETDLFLVAIAGSSMSLPRPYNQKVPSKDPELATSFKHTYPFLLDVALRKNYPAKFCAVNSYAIRGSGIGQAEARARDLFSWLKASVSVYHFGVGDAWLRGENFDTTRVSTEKFKAGLESIIQLKEELNPLQPAFFFGLLPTNSHMLAKSPQQNKVISEWNAIYKSVVDRADLNCKFIDMEAQFAIHGEVILHPDGHHLSNSGHKLAAGLLFKEITEALNV